MSTFKPPSVKIRSSVLAALLCAGLTQSSLAESIDHRVTLSGGLSQDYAANIVVVANRDPASMERTGQFILMLRDPSERNRQVQLAMIDPATPAGTYELVRVDDPQSDRIQACLFLNSARPTAFRRQDIHCDIESGVLNLTENTAAGVSGDFSFRVLRNNAAPIDVAGYFTTVRPPQELRP
ncbi:MAG: hypothetical protein AAGJ52_06875 [Pseudomonadota bacterium]